MEVDTPSATTGVVPVMLELAATGGPAIKITTFPVFDTGVKSCRVLLSATSELSVQVDIPMASETEQAL